VERFRAISKLPQLKNTDDHIIDIGILDARIAMESGDFAQAYARATDALRGRGYFEGKRKPVFRAALLLASEAALGSHLPDSALHLARDARSIAALDSLAESRSAFVGEARLAEGRALLARGDTAAAQATLERASVALRAGAGAAHPLARETESLLSALRR
jgi:hypothetical protein